MKILIAGLKYAPNQFTRALQQYKIQWVHIPGGERGSTPHVPVNCDAAIIARAQIGYPLIKEVKERYLAAGKPVFVSDTGFAPIAIQFEQWLKDQGYMTDFGLVKKQHDEPKAGVMAAAFAQAMPPIPKERHRSRGMGRHNDDDDYAEISPKALQALNPKPTEEENVSELEFRRIPKDIKPALRKLILDCRDANMGWDDMAKMVRAEGFKDFGGNLLNEKQVRNFFYSNDLHKIARGHAPTPPVVMPAAPRPEPAPPPRDAAPRGNDMTLLAKVLESNLPDQRKLTLLGWVKDNKITGETTIFILETVKELLQEARNK